MNGGEAFKVSPEFATAVREQGMEGTHAGALSALADVVAKCEEAVEAGRITAEQAREICHHVGDSVLPKELPTLAHASPDQFLAVCELALMVIELLDKGPELVERLLAESRS